METAGEEGGVSQSYVFLISTKEEERRGGTQNEHESSSDEKL